MGFHHLKSLGYYGQTMGSVNPDYHLEKNNTDTLILGKEKIRRSRISIPVGRNTFL
jgi:hypothetical protein